MLVGVDSIESERMSKNLNDNSLKKFFTDYEIEYSNVKNKVLRLAGIFCAKEAFLKALGIGIGGAIKLHEIEVNHMENGKPYLKLSEEAKKYVNNLGYTSYEINISHTDTFSFAVCIIN